MTHCLFNISPLRVNVGLSDAGGSDADAWTLHHQAQIKIEPEAFGKLGFRRVADTQLRADRPAQSNLSIDGLASDTIDVTPTCHRNSVSVKNKAASQAKAAIGGVPIGQQLQ